jgi:serine/threonine protein kinase
MRSREEEVFKDFEKDNKFKINKDLGKGSFGYVKEITYNNKIYAAKLIKKDANDIHNESSLILEFRGPGIVKVNKIFTEKYSDREVYDLIVMEKASLKNLHKFIDKLYKDNLLNLIFKNPFELVGENLLRFLTIQLMKGLELLNRAGYSHFDIKPGNILLFLNMVVKFTDFRLLRNPEKSKNNDNIFHIPGGTRGYLTPEYYSNNEKVSVEDALKQDYFALGSTLYSLKYGEDMLDYSKYLDPNSTSDVIIDLLQKAMDQIKSKKLSDKEFINFLCGLIQYKPEERPDLELIYRNKWLNKNTEDIRNIAENFELDEEKLIIELDKSDFLINKRNTINENRQKENIGVYRNKFKFSLD